MLFLKKYSKKFIVYFLRFFYLTTDYFLLIFYSIKNLILHKKLFEDDIVFLSAIDKNFYENFLIFAKSYYKHLENSLILYDLGLEKIQINEIKKQFPQIKLKKFNFDKYPSFISEYTDGKLGQYAWKPIVIHETLFHYKCKVVWIDGGSVVTKKILNLKIFLTAIGLLSPISSNRLVDWTHPKTIDIIGLDTKYFNKRNFSGGLVCFDYNYDNANKISKEWFKFALNQDCISPESSNRSNHRQDQAILSVLFYKYFLKYRISYILYPKTNFAYGILFHGNSIFK